MLQVVDATASRLQTGGLCLALSIGFPEQWSWGPRPLDSPSLLMQISNPMHAEDLLVPTHTVCALGRGPGTNRYSAGTVEWAGGGQAWGKL